MKNEEKRELIYLLGGFAMSVLYCAVGYRLGRTRERKMLNKEIGSMVDYMHDSYTKSIKTQEALESVCDELEEVYERIRVLERKDERIQELITEIEGMEDEDIFGFDYDDDSPDEYKAFGYE